MAGLRDGSRGEQFIQLPGSAMDHAGSNMLGG